MAYCSTDDVLAVLRLSTGDVDEARIADAVEATAAMIDDELAGRDLELEPFDETELRLLRQVNTDSAARWYEAVRSPGGYVDVGDPTGLPARLPRDPLAGSLALLDAVHHPQGFA